MEKQKCPEIRFNQFNENWSITSLGDLMKVGSVKRVHQADWCKTGVRFLRARDIVAFAKNEDIADPIYISSDRYEEYSKLSGTVKVGDLLVTGVGTIGVPMLVKNDDPLYFKDGNVIWFKNENAINGLFLYYSFINKTTQNFIKDSAGIGTVGTYTITSGKRTPIYLPKENEQTQIGIFFKNLDQSIALHEKKLAQTKNLKKAMLEKMFPKVGNKQPEIRLKGFSGDWELKSLSDVSEKFEYGLNAQATTFDGINKYIRITDIDDESRKFILADITSPNICFENCEKYKLSTGDILFARTGASVGKTYIYLEEDGLVYFAGFLIRAKVKDTFDANFIFTNTLTERFNKFVLLTSQRSGQPGINAKEYGEYEFYCPNKDEQESIGRFFRYLDETLVLQQQQLQTLKNLKQAFLEKMFV
ncbi:hypothetical protein DIW83_14335 [Acinetobacter nosocomialis]|uniref:restriction endonuclease subunit S n=1 Tax=Acinetobacter nosocomialis TaxID=106654 RepID=UPI0002EB5FC8|nr:restriction endonuclease subunit S [Acinetobacter nosocomialis]AWL20118.1 hypothetical protein DIW83_14335 [Acinetobacter nosocomialis]